MLSCFKWYASKITRIVFTRFSTAIKCERTFINVTCVFDDVERGKEGDNVKKKHLILSSCISKKLVKMYLCARFRTRKHQSFFATKFMQLLLYWLCKYRVNKNVFEIAVNTLSLFSHYDE